MIPSGTRLINLRENSKAPASVHGHKDAVPQQDFVQTGTNVGLVLDGMFLLVDIDNAENDTGLHLLARCRKENPWEQKTPRGYHLLFRTPKDWKGTNVSLHDDKGNVYGDIKALGYAVGPGSVVNGTTYQVTNAVEPPLAPQWLLEMAAKPARASLACEERAGIPYGEHDRYLVSLAGYLRGKEGLTENAILGVLEGGPLMALAGHDETKPYTSQDFRRIARTAMRWEAKREEHIDLVHPSLRSAVDIQLVGPTIEWIVRGFVPRAELVLMYGPGGIGKSSMASWLSAEVNRQGLTFCYMGTEEPSARFFGRAILAGANRAMCYDVVNPGAIKVPRDSELLRTMILESKLDVLYIDSIYSHFEHVENQNAAEKARAALAPLLAIAHETGCTIFGVFHTNKAGAFLGSTEMENVARCLLEAKRSPQQTYLGVRVHKTNLYNPQKLMRLEGREEIFRDEEGNVQLERDEQGNEIPLKIIVPQRIEDIDDNPEAPMEFDQEEIGEEQVNTKAVIRAYLESHPEASNQEIANFLGIGLSPVKKYAAEYFKERDTFHE